MPKQKKKSPEEVKEEAIDTLQIDLEEHYQIGKQDNDTRRTRKNGFNDVIKAYFGILPKNWPYLTQITDPVIRTTILEKTARLFNGKLRGRVIPREGGDVAKARVHNAILDYQWDASCEGGSMIEKWALMDTQTRLFGISFGLVYWKKTDNYEGNEFHVLDNRNVFVDPQATHIKNANYVQVIDFKTLDELENMGFDEEKIAELREKVSRDGYYGDRRDNIYDSKIKEIRNLEDRVGSDRTFPKIEIVTEYRPERRIVFARRYKIVLEDIKNPFKHKRIPIVQLRYYPVGDDIYGESEVESVLPISRAINAILCGYVDSVNIRMRPPVKISNANEVRVDSIIYGPNAKWFVGSNQNNVQEHQPSGDAISNFQASYSSLKAAFATAMGDNSLGVSNIKPFQQDKTATEVAALTRQQLSRDQYNQMYLEEALKDYALMAISNNQQFLLNKASKSHLVLRIVGADVIRDLKEMGMADKEYDSRTMDRMAEIMADGEETLNNGEIMRMLEDTAKPKYPVILNPNEENPANYDIRPKLDIQEDSAELYVTDSDMEPAVYDFIPDVKSMALGAGQEQIQGRDDTLKMLLTPAVSQALLSEGIKLKVKDLLVDVLRDKGIRAPEKFFEQAEQNQQSNTTGTDNFGQIPQNGGIPGIPAMDAGPIANVGGVNPAGGPSVSQPQGL